MPVYNEQTSRTYAALEAIYESVEATGLGAHFDYFILSDTTDPDAWIAEERAFLALRERLGPGRAILLPAPREELSPQGRQHRRFRETLGRSLRAHARARRRQPDDRRMHRAPCRRHGSRSGCRHHPVAAADHQPQHAVRPSAAIRRPRDRPGDRDRTCRSGWAATAITGATTPSSAPRPSPRRAACRISRASLRSAAISSATISSRRRLLRRAGWDVYMLADLGGSYEESPPSLIDLSARDRRWCQGNLQHTRVIGAKGLKLADPAAFRHRHHVVSGLAVLAVPADRRYRAGAADDLYPAGIFRPRLPALSDLAALRPRARLDAVRHHHGHPASRRRSSA